MNKLILPKDVIILPQSNDRWVAYNLFAKTCLGVDGRTLAILGDLQGMTTYAAELVDAREQYCVWDISHFSNLGGLMDDPSRYIRNTEAWPKCRTLSVADLIAVLKENFILIVDMDQYRARFQPVTGILDREHFGNFHEQLGRALLARRERPAQFWYSQKFTPDFAQVKENLYQAVQENFLRDFIPERFSDRSLRVLDVACGTGYYTNKIGATGVEVVGVDINETSLSIARESAPPNVQYRHADMQLPGGLEFLGREAFDLIFLSDALLFYFCPLDKSESSRLLTPETFFKQVSYALKPNGRLIIMEPHYLFWLTPWLGEVDFPFTVFTEYLNRKFMVTPPFSTFFQAASRGGFALTNMTEIQPDPKFESVDKRAFCFAREFPLWHVFEFARIQ